MTPQQQQQAWMTRRQVALETGLDAFKRMTACKTPLEAALIYGEWLSGSMIRILADVEDFQKASLTLFASKAATPAESPAPHQLRQAA